MQAISKRSVKRECNKPLFINLYSILLNLYMLCIVVNLKGQSKIAFIKIFLQQGNKKEKLFQQGFPVEVAS